jgi:hypothetical protein
MTLFRLSSISTEELADLVVLARQGTAVVKAREMFPKTHESAVNYTMRVLEAYGIRWSSHSPEDGLLVRLGRRDVFLKAEWRDK